MIELIGTPWVKADEEEAAREEPRDMEIPAPSRAELNHWRKVMRAAALKGAVVEINRVREDRLSTEAEI